MTMRGRPIIRRCKRCGNATTRPSNLCLKCAMNRAHR